MGLFTKDPGLGMIAICSNGDIGLILSSEKEKIIYKDGNEALAWTGIHLSEDKLGQMWSSKNPKVIKHISDLKEIKKLLK